MYICSSRALIDSATGRTAGTQNLFFTPFTRLFRLRGIVTFYIAITTSLHTRCPYFASHEPKIAYTRVEDMPIFHLKSMETEMGGDGMLVDHYLKGREELGELEFFPPAQKIVH